MRHRPVFSFELNGQKALGFDTGLDSRAFAQAKFAQAITEPGVIVKQEVDRIDVALWKASGVIEGIQGQDKPTMVVWGPDFEGECLDVFIDDEDRKDEALKALFAWIQAIRELEKTTPPVSGIPFCPGAAMVKGHDVFFAPPSLARRSLDAQGGAFPYPGRYVHPDLEGADLAAFTAAAMLYRIFAGTPPFPADAQGADESLLHHDMRDGHFLPIQLAAYGLDDTLSSLIQSALSPPPQKDNKPAKPPGAVFLDEFLVCLRDKTVSQLVGPVTDERLLTLEKEKAKFLGLQTASVKTRRFVTRNTTLLIGSLAVFFAVILFIHNMARSRALLPTTAGMNPVEVIEAYYNAIGEMDHQLMEACVTGNAGKGDINMVMHYFVINTMRLAYDPGAPPLLISARLWQENGSAAIPSGVLGVTDLLIDRLENRELYRVQYTLWHPAEMDDEPERRSGNRLPSATLHRDLVSLVRIRGNWRISDIQRH